MRPWLLPLRVYSNCPATDKPEAIIELADVWMRHAYTGKPVIKAEAPSLAGVAS